MNLDNLTTHSLEDYLEQLQVEPRIERKFIVPRSRLAEAERLVRFHPLRFSQIYAPRRINNIYLDAMGFKYYNDSIEGLSKRIKIRLRWYGELMNSFTKPGLELKLKNNTYGYKLVYPLPGFTFSGKSNPVEVSAWLNSQSIPEVAQGLMSNLHPVLVNSYMRTYWESHDHKVRMTIDNDLEYYPFARSTDTLLAPACYDNHSILEIKNHPVDDQGMSDFANAFLPRITRYSKYTNGVDLLFNEQSMSY